jgi:hypothetical protein
MEITLQANENGHKFGVLAFEEITEKGNGEGTEAAPWGLAIVRKSIGHSTAGRASGGKLMPRRFEAYDHQRAI